MAQHIDLENSPTITLGGKQWVIPLLAARQNRIIDPLILKLMPIFAEMSKDQFTGLGLVTEESYRHFQEICFVAITRNDPTVTRDMFLDLPVTLTEMVSAFPIIAGQTGIFKKADKGDIPSGEAPGAAVALPQSPLTGTAS